MMFFCILTAVLVLLWLCALRIYSFGRLLILFLLHAFWGGLTLGTVHLAGSDVLAFGADFAVWLAVPLIFLAAGRKHRLVSSLLGTIASVSSLAFTLPCLAYWWKTGALFSKYAASAVLQTDFLEAREFVASFLGRAQIYSALFSLFLVFLIFFWAYYETFSHADAEKKAGGTVLACVLMLMTAGLVTQTVVGRSFMDAFSARKVYSVMPSAAERRTMLLSDTSFTGGFGNVALIIGESQTAGHMGVYGYARETTPWLSEAATGEDVVLFQHAYAAGTSTSAVLPLMLTEKNQYNGLDTERAVTLVEAAHTAGYRVVFLSMQGGDGMSAFLASEADEAHFLGTSEARTDGTVADFLRNRIPDNCCKTLYIIQLIGCHAKYSERYPQDFRLWGNTAADTYDNAVTYSDHIFRELTGILTEVHGVGAVFSVADHGEETDRFFHHGEDIFLKYWETEEAVRNIVRIPAFIYTTPEYRDRNRKLMQCLRQNAGGCFTNDLTYDLVLGLMGIGGDRIHSEYDFSSPVYRITQDTALTAEGRVPVKELDR